MTDDRQQMFTERYENQQTPWDTGITPPELVAYIAEASAGRALDLGCGTGTNVRYMVEHGWQADGIDFVPQAIDTANAKLADHPAEAYRFAAHDVTDLPSCAMLRPPYDLLVDIGCGHGLPADKQAKYAADSAALLRVGGVFMLYTHKPHDGSDRFGWNDDDIERLFGPYYTITLIDAGYDVAGQRNSGWYRMQRNAD